LTEKTVVDHRHGAAGAILVRVRDDKQFRVEVVGIDRNINRVELRQVEFEPVFIPVVAIGPGGTANGFIEVDRLENRVEIVSLILCKND